MDAIVRAIDLLQQSRRPGNDANLLGRVLLSDVSRSLNARRASTNDEHGAGRINLALAADAFAVPITSGLPLVVSAAPRRRVRRAGANDERVIVYVLRL